MSDEETLTDDDKDFIDGMVVRRYPAFQYSVFVGDRQEQLVIRADTYKEFLEQKKLLDGIVSKMKARKTSDAIKRHEPVEKQEGLTGHCKVHGVSMQERKSKKTGKTYWAHWSEDNKICFGEGYQ